MSGKFDLNGDSGVLVGEKSTFLAGEKSTFLGCCNFKGDSYLSWENLAGVFCGVLVGVMHESGMRGDWGGTLEGVLTPLRCLFEGLRERGEAERRAVNAVHKYRARAFTENTCTGLSF